MEETVRQTLIQELNLSHMSHEDADNVIVRLGGLILEDVITSVVDIMTDDQVIMFERILESRDQEKVVAFLVETIPDLDRVVADSSKKIVKEHLSAVS